MQLFCRYPFDPREGEPANNRSIVQRIIAGIRLSKRANLPANEALIAQLRFRLVRIGKPLLQSFNINLQNGDLFQSRRRCKQTASVFAVQNTLK